MKIFIFILLTHLVFYSHAVAEPLGENLQNNDLELSQPDNSSDPFGQAEYLFHSGKFLEAKPFYHDYISSNSTGKRRYLALLRLGLIDQANRSYYTAARFYQIFIEEFPRSPEINTARFNMAICFQELTQYAQAEALYKVILRSTPDKKRKWEVMYRLAQVNASQMNYEESFLKLKNIYNQIENNEIHQQAIKAAKGLIDNELDSAQISTLIQKFGSGFPVDLLLLRKIAFFRSAGDIARYTESIEKFIAMFPGQSSKVESWLSQAKNNAEAKIKIGVVLPLTGKLAQTGQRVLQGIQLAINQLPFKSREQLTLDVRDSGGQRPVEEVMVDLVALPNVVGVIGPLLSDEVSRVGGIAQQYKIPIFSPTASTQGLVDENPYIFRNALTREIQAKFLADYSINTLKLRRFAVLYPFEPFGLELKDTFIQEIESMGGEVVAVSGYDRSQTDFKRQILELGGVEDDELLKIGRNMVLNDEQVSDFSNPTVLSRPIIDMAHWTGENIEKLKVSLELSYDAVFIPGVYDKVGLIIPQLAFYNVDDITLLGTNGWNSPELVEMGGKYLKTVYFVDGYHADSHQPEVSQFVQKFKSNFGEDPVYLSAQAFDAANIFLSNILRGADNRIKMWGRLKKVKDFPGVTGKTTLLPSGDSQKNIFALTVKRKKIVQKN